MPQRIELATGTLQIAVRQAMLPLADLCGFAARNNRKRGFLFVSKVLGKHWPTAPTQMRQVHELLAQSLHLRTNAWLCVAMAETATGVGQGVFEALLKRYSNPDALFLHSTRYQIADWAHLQFQEPHCHAPDQLLYEPRQLHLRQRFYSARELILIDDEISTGATLCNLANAYRARNPQLARVHFVALTDFSGEHSAERFSAQIGLPVTVNALLHGDFSFIPNSITNNEIAAPAVGNNRRNPAQLAIHLGRFGIDRQLEIPTADLEQLSAGLNTGARLLVLGTGEFMHLAFRIGLALEAKGFAVVVQATTRSPILLGADIKNRLMFGDNYGEGIANYLYNVSPDEFVRIIICHETPSADLNELRQSLGSCCITYRPDNLI
ncbi:phosphoribosyltransferase domain-containing protein [Chromatium okenii]|uniref:phosphoribosyltransferase domain-containing protein n=1 Tax=Chromatium okenii TaxID=61644 RepID=UPI0026F2B08A|nr:phosphoribosyltransferase domain-containing protein [Chromatium okenii]MBV5311237.1 phosphoribosyltransferase domain-containing protein [Chromatium okenii]